MKLLLDIGNTRIKWALADGNVLPFAHSGEHRHEGLFAQAIADVLSTLPVKPESVAACSVAGDEACVSRGLRRDGGSFWVCLCESDPGAE